MKILPKQGLWDSVYTDPKSPSIKRSFIRSLFCEHEDIQRYRRSDHRGGAGLLIDTYSGTVCTHCGGILNEKKTS